jgi:hypothetical protein
MPPRRPRVVSETRQGGGAPRGRGGPTTSTRRLDSDDEGELEDEFNGSSGDEVGQGGGRGRQTREEGGTSEGGTVSDLSTVGSAEGRTMAVLGGSKEDRKRDMTGSTVKVFAKRLFNRKKFILDEKELEYSTTNTRSICYQCLTALNASLDTSREFWEEYKHVVTSELNNKRSNVAYAMRDTWNSKCW